MPAFQFFLWSLDVLKAGVFEMGRVFEAEAEEAVEADVGGRAESVGRPAILLVRSICGIGYIAHYKSEWLFGGADATGCNVRIFSKQRDRKSGVKAPHSKLEGES